MSRLPGLPSAAQSNFRRLAPSSTQPRATGYRVAEVLALVLAILVGWAPAGDIASGGSTAPTIVRAAVTPPTYPLYAWGENIYGEFGNGTFNNNPNPNPVAVTLPAGIVPTQVTAGYEHNLAIGSDGKLYAWGYNAYGQLGNGTSSGENPNPTPVVVGLPGGAQATTVAGGGYHSLAIGSNGKLYAWGWNYYGQLGNGTTSGLNPNSTPLTVSLAAGVQPTAIAGGYEHSLAIGSDGKLYAWGWNLYGQLGNGTTTDSSIPVTVSLAAGVRPTAIAAGYLYSLAIGSDGKLYAWGSNRYGQLGNGTTTDSSTPVTVSLPAGVRATVIVASYSHSLAIGSDGKLYAWGYNRFGQLGNGTSSGENPNPTPVAVGSVAGVAKPLLTARGYYSLAVLVIPSQIAATGGTPQSIPVGTAFATPLVATVRDFANNPVGNATVTFTAPVDGAGGTFAGGSSVYTSTTDAGGVVTATTFTANTILGSYNLTATVSGVITPATFALTNLSGCTPRVVTSNLDDGSCGTLRYAVLSLASPLTGKAKTITVALSAGSVITLTTGLTLTSGVSITTTASCGVGAGNTMLPPVTVQGVGPTSGNGLTLAGNNKLYGLWVRGFSGVQIKAPARSFTKMQCIRASKL